MTDTKFFIQIKEINAINLLGGLGIINDPNHAKYLGFSDIYPVIIKEVKRFLNPA